MPLTTTATPNPGPTPGATTGPTAGYAPAAMNPGAAVQPVGDPLLSGMGPAAWANRADVPDLTVHGDAKIVPMRVAQNFYVEPRDPDPRGMPVLGTDGVTGGVVMDLWVDRAEPSVRYLEIAVPDGRRVLMPMAVCKVDRRRGVVRTKSILGRQFANVPATRREDQVTLLEEDKIMAYYAGGYLYATASRAEPLV